jgi:hypothetical protein
MESAGIEPAITGLQDQRLADLATTPKTADRSGGDRTHDILFVREALLPLSYAPKKSDWETWIRTTIGGFRVRSPAVRRSPNIQKPPVGIEPTSCRLRDGCPRHSSGGDAFKSE